MSKKRQHTALPSRNRILYYGVRWYLPVSKGSWIVTGASETTGKCATDTPSLCAHPVVRLNIGGRKFATFRSTLKRADKGSPLTRPSLFTERVFCDGAAFFDRDAGLFHYILDYLREVHDDAGVPFLPHKPDDLKKLIVEADFYKVNALAYIARKRLTDINSESFAVEAGRLPGNGEKKRTPRFQRST
jgi:hypothetical protein